MTRVLSGIQPTGDVHLGNYMGAIRHWVTDQHSHDALYCVVDLHSLTEPRDPAEVRRKTCEVASILLAAGLDPEVCTVFVQSHVAAHSELAWMLSCIAGFGEVARMTQFKSRSDESDSVTAGLFGYPVLMAADILLYDADRVPVGRDQRQHLELCRDLANRFNHRYGQTFTVPQAAVARIGAMVMDLQDPTRKMSKSRSGPQGMIILLEPPESMTKKIKRAVTDNEAEVRYDPLDKPGVSNLLELLAVATDGDPTALADKYENYGSLKADTAAALVEFLRPLHERFKEIQADPGYVEGVVAKGGERARELAAPTMTRVREALGLLPVSP
jgi:tryptophanyl-tRNA synthetase